jgi:hypothetical protein
MPPEVGIHEWRIGRARTALVAKLGREPTDEEVEIAAPTTPCRRLAALKAADFGDQVDKYVT